MTAPTFPWLRWLRFALIVGLPVALLLIGRARLDTELWILTGPEGSSTEAMGQQYAEYIKAHGVQAHVVPADGVMENIEALQQHTYAPAVALTQSGMLLLPGARQEDSELVALASVSIEPLWLFVSPGANITGIQDLRERKVAIGVSGSAANAVASMLLAANGLEDSVIPVLIDDYTPNAVAAMVASGTLDAIFLEDQPDSRRVHRILELSDLIPVSLDRSAAYAMHFPALAHIVLPEGGVNLARNIPAQDIHALATVIELLTTESMPPALVNLILTAATEIHTERTPFSERGHFPNMEHLDAPIHRMAKRFFTDGPPAVFRMFPYWLAAILNGISLMAGLMVGAGMVLLTLIPKLLGASLNRRLMLAYKRMVTIEQNPKTRSLDQLIADLSQIEHDTGLARVYWFNRRDYLEFRQHIFDTRERLRERARKSPPAE